MEPVDVLIVGAGIAGLTAAYRLVGRTSVQVVEARERVGGRASSRDVAGALVDVGPAWIWPHQPRVLALVDALDLACVEQHSEGALVFQHRSGEVERHDFSTMAGALRVVGGMQNVATGLAARLPVNTVATGTALRRLRLAGDAVVAELECAGDRSSVRASRVVLAVPPRLVVAHVRFDPVLPSAVVRTLDAVPTWMAGHAKALAVYPRPFWRADGLSGDGMSHRGPLVEIHDASPLAGGRGALFGFFGLPASTRAAHRDALPELVRAQLAAMFGASAGEPDGVEIVDWAESAWTATDADATSPRQHPAYGPMALGDSPWAGRVELACSETAQAEGGYVEGAVIAGETVAERVLR